MVDIYEEMKERFKDDPREVTYYTLPNGQVIVRVGKLNTKLFVEKVLELYL